VSVPPPLGLIAGKGELARVVCKTAMERSTPVVAVTFDEEVEGSLKQMATTHLQRIGEAGKAIKTFKDAGVQKVLMIGKFDKKLAFKDLLPDATGIKIFAKAVTKRDSSIMLSIINEIESAGLKVEKQTDWLPASFLPSGEIGKTAVSPKIMADFKYGLDICRDIADKDIGQTIIVKEGTVIAVEAVEGTDACIERGCSLAGSSAVMIKTSRPNQDLRFDIPSVGPRTAEMLVKQKAGGLAIEAGKVVVAEKEKTASILDKAGIPFTAI